jgi:hypothetical protein
MAWTSYPQEVGIHPGKAVWKRHVAVAEMKCAPSVAGSVKAANGRIVRREKP